MSERDNIFRRVREALRVSARAPSCSLPSLEELRSVLPVVSTVEDEQLAQFKINAAELRADFKLVSDAFDLVTNLRALGKAEGWKKVATHDGGLSGLVSRTLNLPVLLTDSKFDKNELASCDAGITECDALIAQTGSVLVTSRTAGGRALSCLPPHHVVIARRGQVVPDLPAAFEFLQRKYPANYPSMISLITGPSRTGDIERILVLGAHGPKKLTIYMIDK